MSKKVSVYWGLIILVSFLTGCNNFDNTSLGEETVGNQEKQFERVQQEERPVSQRVRSLTSLKAGHGVPYYLDEFTRLGYKVVTAKAWDDGVAYELHKADGTTALFYMLTPNQVDVVKEVAVIPAETLSKKPLSSNITTAQMQQNVKQLPIGKQPAYYLPTIRKYGTLKEFRVLDQSKAVYEVEAANQIYKITMTTNPDNGRVQSIKLTS